MLASIPRVCCIVALVALIGPRVAIAEAAKRAGPIENVSPHWLRHAAITLWATEMGLPAAQRLAGHKGALQTAHRLRFSRRMA